MLFSVHVMQLTQLVMHLVDGRKPTSIFIPLFNIIDLYEVLHKFFIKVMKSHNEAPFMDGILFTPRTWMAIAIIMHYKPLNISQLLSTYF